MREEEDLGKGTLAPTLGQQRFTLVDLMWIQLIGRFAWWASSLAFGELRMLKWYPVKESVTNVVRSKQVIAIFGPCNSQDLDLFVSI